jgi:AraC-like DNA-binding protein
MLWFFLAVTPLLCVAAYLVVRYEKPFEVISEEKGLQTDFVWNTYTDQLHQGKSEIHKTGNDAFEYQYRLKEGYRFKFALIGIEGRHSKVFDLSAYNEIDICLKAQQGKGVLFYLYTAFPKEKKLNHPSRPHQYILHADTSFTQLILPMQELYTPDWWYIEVNETRAGLGEPLYEKTLGISFGNCVHMKVETPDVVTIRNLRFSVNLWPYFIQTLPYVVGYYFLIFLYHVISKKRRKKLVLLERPVLPDSEQQSDEQRVFERIGAHYFEPNYSIEKLSRQVDMPETKVHDIIQHKTGLRFKPFINYIRIKEAERLLSETDLPVYELAEKVGFKTREHFNRLFKSQTGFNPLEIRKKQHDLSTKQDEQK